MFVPNTVSYLSSIHFSLPSAQLNTFLLIKMCYSVTKFLNTFMRTSLQKFLYTLLPSLQQLLKSNEPNLISKDTLRDEGCL